MADSYGRKKMVLVYCVVYTISCLAKHCKSFLILLLGRVLGGIATSLLFSVFDAWLIQAHDLRNIDKSFLSKSFSASNFGSSVVAILAGLFANTVVGTTADSGTKSSLRPAFHRAAQVWYAQEAQRVSQYGPAAGGPPTDANDARWDTAWVYTGGGIAAFDLALIPLALCFGMALWFWDENYGEMKKEATGERKGHNKTRGMFAGLHSASTTIWRSQGIFGLCAVTSFFEGAMYVFILLWTPALRAIDTHPEEENYPGPPLGIVFATFMVCCMLGTSIFAILSSKGVQPSRMLVFVLAMSSLSCLTIATTSNDTVSYCAMLLFEGCIGAYYPAMSTVKGNIVPEDQRAAIYSVFRLPMNLVVLINLVSNLGFQAAFSLCFAMLALATALQIRVVKYEAVSLTLNPTTTSSSHEYQDGSSSNTYGSRELQNESSSMNGTHKKSPIPMQLEDNS